MRAVGPYPDWPLLDRHVGQSAGFVGTWLCHSATLPDVLGTSPALCDPMDCSWPGSSVHGILQARILEWVAIPFFGGSSQPRSPSLQADTLPSELPGKPLPERGVDNRTTCSLEASNCDRVWDPLHHPKRWEQLFCRLTKTASPDILVESEAFSKSSVWKNNGAVRCESRESWQEVC